jgi:uncharacterized lipoprotein YmbA
MRPTALLAIVCMASGLATGCATQQPFRYYTLRAAAGPAAAASTLEIALGPVTVPAVVDRPEIVVSTGRNELRLDDFNRWASPLQDNLSRVMADDLAMLLGSPRVTRFPQPLAVEPDYRVAVEVRSFESTLGESASIDAVWTIRRIKDRKTQTGQTSVRERVADPGYEALAGAHSRAAAKVSQDIADAIRQLQRDAP